MIQGQEIGWGFSALKNKSIRMPDPKSCAFADAWALSPSNHAAKGERACGSRY